jgi:hypothetical protein
MEKAPLIGRLFSFQTVNIPPRSGPIVAAPWGRNPFTGDDAGLQGPNTMSKLTSLITAAALLSTLALPALATTQHGAKAPVVRHPVHRVAATATDVTAKPLMPMATMPATPSAAKPAAAAPAPVATKPAPVKPN